MKFILYLEDPEDDLFWYPPDSGHQPFTAAYTEMLPSDERFTPKTYLTPKAFEREGGENPYVKWVEEKEPLPVGWNETGYDHQFDGTHYNRTVDKPYWHIDLTTLEELAAFCAKYSARPIFYADADPALVCEKTEL